MSLLKRRSVLIITAILVALSVIYFGGRYWLIQKIEKSVEKQLQALQEQGITITFDSIKVDPWAVAAAIHKINIQIVPDDSLTHKGNIKASLITIKGLSLLPLIKKHILHFGEIAIYNPHVSFSQGTNTFSKKREKAALEQICIDHILISKAFVQLKDSTSSKILVSLFADMEADNFTIKNSLEDKLDFNASKAIASQIKIQLPEQFYDLTIKRLAYLANKHSLEVDSLHINPIYYSTSSFQQEAYQGCRLI